MGRRRPTCFPNSNAAPLSKSMCFVSVATTIPPADRPGKIRPRRNATDPYCSKNPVNSKCTICVRRVISPSINSEYWLRLMLWESKTVGTANAFHPSLDHVLQHYENQIGCLPSLSQTRYVRLSTHLFGASIPHSSLHPPTTRFIFSSQKIFRSLF